MYEISLPRSEEVTVDSKPQVDEVSLSELPSEAVTRRDTGTDRGEFVEVSALLDPNQTSSRH